MKSFSVILRVLRVSVLNSLAVYCNTQSKIENGACPSIQNPQSKIENGAGLSSAQRLHDPGDFQRVYEAKTAIHAPHVVVFFRSNGLAWARLGVSVGRKHGNAVRRNRIKRVMRAAFRQCRDLLPPAYDYVLVPRRGVREYSTALVSGDLRTAAARISAGKFQEPNSKENNKGQNKK